MSDTTLSTIEAALGAAEEILPTIAPLLAAIPGLGPVVPFLSLLPTVIEGIQKIQQATGSSQTGAITAWRAHNTAGMSNAPALAERAASQASA